nr:FAD-dependent oxidoreductase [Candidatus Eremiobacteraeota bacterium]
MPVDVIKAPPREGPSPGKVAIVGAGFAGCSAAYVASQLGFNVTVYDGNGVPGGRVKSSRDIVPGRILELGAELIGLNHPAWLLFAAQFGLGLSVLTTEDKYAGAHLHSPLILNGRTYDTQAQQKLHDDMQTVLDPWLNASQMIKEPFTPWTTPNAPAMDAMNLGAQIPASTAPDVAYAISTTFELDNCVKIGDQSWLANLAQFKAGGSGQGFFDDSEVFRCTAGNQQLAFALLGTLPLVAKTVTAIDTTSRVTLTFSDGTTQGGYDYVVVATAPTMWASASSSILVDGQPFPFAPVQTGPAIKYLSPVDKRFWIQDGLSPSALSDEPGMLWEGSENQADTAGFDLSVFSGGTGAQKAIDAIGSGSPDPYFKPQIAQLYPNYATGGGTFVVWPTTKGVMTGYSCPAPGQVVGAQQS